MLERVETMAGQYQDVMVLHNQRDERAAAWCEERGWKYHHGTSIYGCEAQCVVLLDCYLYPEWITRARNFLIIINRYFKFLMILCSVLRLSISNITGGTLKYCRLQWITKQNVHNKNVPF